MVDVSVVLPCLNEAGTVRGCVAQIQATLEMAGLEGEVVVADNGSSDGSRELAAGAGARVIDVPERGYGSALMGGIAAASGRYVVIGDADGQHDFRDIPRFLASLDRGFELVVGNRFGGRMKPGTMSWLNRRVGNPLLSGLGRWLFDAPCRDFHCGLRAFRHSAYDRMQLRAPGMEFASEMIVKASLLRMRITEEPTSISASLRRSHLRQFNDGWRHLILLLRYAWDFRMASLQHEPAAPAEPAARFDAD